MMDSDELDRHTDWLGHSVSMTDERDAAMQSIEARNLTLEKHWRFNAYTELMLMI